MARVTDMTHGRPIRLILLFSLPLMLGSVFQQLYTIVDTIIIGRGVGMQALASIGAADWINWLVLWGLQGFTQGFAILAAQEFGAVAAAAAVRSADQSRLENRPCDFTAPVPPWHSYRSADEHDHTGRHGAAVRIERLRRGVRSGLYGGK